MRAIRVLRDRGEGKLWGLCESEEAGETSQLHPPIRTRGRFLGMSNWVVEFWVVTEAPASGP